jgi:hypothetical protein
MDVNKIKIVNSDLEKGIVVPLGMNWDFLDRESSLKKQEEEVVKEVIGIPVNYELSRFSNEPTNFNSRQLGYIFHFSPSVEGPWENSYLSKFTELQVRYRTDAFKKSFFKLDFYNSMDPKTQKNYLSVILQTSQSYVEIPSCSEYRLIIFQAGFGTFTYTDCCGNEQVWTKQNIGDILNFCPLFNSNATYVRDLEGEITSYDFVLDGDTYDIDEINLFTTSPSCECSSVESSAGQSNIEPLVRPSMLLDYFGNKEGFFLHWFEDRNLLNIDTLYMTAKFFNAATGQYVKFTDSAQTDFGNVYRVPNRHFYYTVNFDYDDKTYEIVSNQTDVATNDVFWFEYVNPPIG